MITRSFSITCLQAWPSLYHQLRQMLPELRLKRRKPANGVIALSKCLRYMVRLIPLFLPRALLESICIAHGREHPSQLRLGYCTAFTSIYRLDAVPQSCCALEAPRHLRAYSRGHTNMYLVGGLLCTGGMDAPPVHASVRARADVPQASVVPTVACSTSEAKEADPKPEFPPVNREVSKESVTSFKSSLKSSLRVSIPHGASQDSASTTSTPRSMPGSKPKKARYETSSPHSIVRFSDGTDAHCLWPIASKKIPRVVTVVLYNTDRAIPEGSVAGH